VTLAESHTEEKREIENDSGREREQEKE